MIPLVSIIIPVYNRFYVIGETIESIIGQTYNNWECIIVDDGSTDYTEELLELYCRKNSRISYFKRPWNLPKGANSCRNFGFKKSRGRLIQFFDSDDLMKPEFLEKKVKALTKSKADFLISRTLNFIDPDPNKIISWNIEYYTFDSYNITNYNFVTQKVHWLTPDFMGTRDICSKVKFNEKLKSAQERNYFSKLTCHSVNAVLIDDYLTERRIHKVSTQARLYHDESLKEKEHLEFLFETWKDLSKQKASSKSLKYLFENGIKSTLRQDTKLRYIWDYTLAFYLEGRRVTAMWYFLYQISNNFFQRGTILRRKFLDVYKIV